MRAAAIAAVAALSALGCGKTYEDLIAGGNEVVCPAEGLCPGKEVCVFFEGEPRCKRNLECSLFKKDCAARYSSAPDYAERSRCTLMRVGPGVVGAECTQPSQFGTSAEGSFCSVLAPNRYGFSIEPLGLLFPPEDRTCVAGLICHTLTMKETPARPDGSCRRFCRNDADCGGSNAFRCLDAFGKTVTDATVSTPDGPVGVCYPSCPLAASGGAKGCEAISGSVCQAAMVLGSTSAEAFGICRVLTNFPAAPLATVPCGENAPCADGWACAPAGSAFACQKMCKPGGTPACTSGQTCNTTALTMPAGIGLCL